MESTKIRKKPGAALPHPTLFLITNLIPLVGIVFFDWNLSQVVILYWLEGIFITLDAYLRVFIAIPSSQLLHKILTILAIIIFFSPFFLMIHFLLFFFLVVPFLEVGELPLSSIGLAFLTLCLTYGLALLKDRNTIPLPIFAIKAIRGIFSDLARLFMMLTIACVAIFLFPLLDYQPIKPFLFVAIKLIIDWQLLISLPARTEFKFLEPLEVRLQSIPVAGISKRS